MIKRFHEASLSLCHSLFVHYLFISLTGFYSICSQVRYLQMQFVYFDFQIKFVAEDSNFGKALDRSANAFQPSQTDGSVKVYIIWGLALQDISQCHMTDLTCLGRTVWDDHFDMNPASSQQALLVSFRRCVCIFMDCK